MRKLLSRIFSNPLLIATILFTVVAVLGLAQRYRWERDVLVRSSFDDAIEKYGYNTEAKIARYTELLKDAYRKDTYGGNTPEETLKLFKTALEAGDTDLAAKYFLLEEQSEMKSKLFLGLTQGGVRKILDMLDLKFDSEPLLDSNTSYSLNYYDNNSLLRYSISFIKNPYNGIWKIESL